jgi:hypothetical protein
VSVEDAAQVVTRAWYLSVFNGAKPDRESAPFL